MVVGYTAGVFDLLHVGHLHRLRRARERCERLIVGVCTDECAASYKRRPIIPFEQRIELVRCLKFVDQVVPQTTLDKYVIWESLRFNVLVVGDEERQHVVLSSCLDKFAALGVSVVFDARYDGTSTSEILARVREG